MDPVARENAGVPRRHLHNGVLAFLVFGALGLVSAPVLHAQPKATEYQVKAAYLFNFAKFVTWPADSPAARSSSFDICILGRDPFGTALDATVAGEKVGDLPVSIRRIDHVAESKDCRIIFISKSEEPRLSSILNEIDSSDVLTVSDIPRFSQHGGMIEFVPEGNRVRFGINLDSAVRSRLTVSSQLLKVATNVISTTRAGGLS